MKRVLPPSVVLTFVALTLVACSSATTSESDVLVDPALLDALEQASEVEVLVSLKPPDIPAEERTVEIRSQDFEERLTRVLDDVDESDFEVLIESEQSGALTGMLTRDGLAALREHGDVEGVALARGEGEVSETLPAITIFTGTMSRLVEQVFVDGVVVDEILEPVTNGRVSIPELGVEQPLGPDGSFSFRRLELPQIPMLVSVEVEADGYRPTTWANNLVLYRGLGWNFTPRLVLGNEPKLTDACPDLMAYSRGSGRKSAAQELRAELCRGLGYR